MESKITPRISIVVASHRKTSMLRLATTFNSMQTSHVQIIVVADYQIDNCIKAYPAFQWIYVQDTNIPKKRNVGSSFAIGEIIAFIDDDCIPSDLWVACALDYLDSHPDIAACEGKTIIKQSFHAAPLKEFKRLEKPGFRTNNIFYRRTIFEAAGKFDERFAFQREDVDLAYSVLSMGYKIGFCDQAIVYHEVRQNEKWDLLKNCINRRFDPLLYRKHPKHYREYIGSPFPPVIGLILLLHCTIVLSTFIVPSVMTILMAGDIVFILAASIRRNWSNKNDLVWICRDCVSFLLSPIVLSYGLIYGFFRYK